MKQILIVFTTVLFISVFSFGQDLRLRNHWPQPSGFVTSILVDDVNESIIVGGKFGLNYWGKNCGFGVSFDSIGDLNSNYPLFNGHVQEVISDGMGGRFISGAFTKVGDSVRNGLVHIDSTGSVTNKFKNIGVSGQVNTMELAEDTLYLGGDFYGLGNKVAYAGVFDSGSEVINGAFPIFDGEITASISDNKGGWYIAGRFQKVGDSSRVGMVHIDSNLQITNWRAHTNGIVESMSLNDSVIFVGGSFSFANGLARKNIAAFNVVSGVILPFNPEITGKVMALEIHDSTLFIGGLFDSVNSVYRTNMAAWNLDSDSLLSWAPNPNGEIKDLEITGNDLIIAGWFLMINGLNQSGLAKYDLSSLSLSSWDPQISAVYSIACSDTSVFVSGAFFSVGGVYHERMAEISMSTGLLTNSSLELTFGSVESLVLKDSILLCGGLINSSTDNFRQFNVHKDEWLSWSPQPNSWVNTISESNGRILMGGLFTTMGGKQVQNLAAIDLVADTVKYFNFNANLAVNDLLYVDSILYVGGDFTLLNGLSRVGLASINVKTNLLTSWVPHNMVPSNVRCKEVEVLSFFDGKVYVGGRFINPGYPNPGNNHYLSRFDAKTAFYDNFLHIQSSIRDMEFKGDTLYMARKNIGFDAIDTSGIKILNYPATINGDMYNVHVSGDSVFTTGNFYDQDGNNRSKVYVVNTNSGAINGLNINLGGGINCLDMEDDDWFFGGVFNSYNGEYTRSLVALLNKRTGELKPKAPVLDSISKHFWFSIKLIHKNRYYFVKGRNPSTIGCYDVAGDSVLSFSIPYTNDINTMIGSGDSIFIGGDFILTGTGKSAVAVFNDSTGIVSNWDPGISYYKNEVNTIEVKNGHVYVGGNFNHSGDVFYRKHVLQIDQQTAQITNWTLPFTGTCFSFVIYDSLITVSGTFANNFHGFVGTKTFKLQNGNIHSEGNFETVTYGKMSVFGNKLLYPSEFKDNRGGYRNDFGLVDLDSFKLTELDLEMPSSIGVNVYEHAMTDDALFIGGMIIETQGQSRNTFAVYKEPCQPLSGIDTIYSCRPYTWIDGITYNTSNSTATFETMNWDGCDSISHLFLIVDSNLCLPVIDTVISCSFSYRWRDGNLYSGVNDSGTYQSLNPNGMDTLYHLNLIIDSSQFYFSTDSVVSCSGNYDWVDGVTYSVNNSTGIMVYSSVNGCDSVVSLHLAIDSTQFGYYSDSIVACDSLVWINGNTYYSSVVGPEKVLSTSAGCDSVVTLNLTINNSSSSIDTITACFFHTWIDGNTYVTNNTTATHTLISSTGCDSIVTLNLSIGYPSTSIDTHVVCDSLVWMDGNTYYANNSTATYNVPGGNSTGCDSTVTLNLTILNSPVTVLNITACDSFSWNGVTYTSSTNIPTDTLFNLAGCDSVVNLNLTINTTSYFTDVVTACDSLTWINGITYYSSTNTPKDTLVNVMGCDSIVTLDLTISSSSAATVYLTDCDSLTWINGETYFNDTTVTHIMTNHIGCDSVITLHATIPHSTSAIDSIVAVNQYTWINGVTYYAHNSSATHTLSNTAGCDSVVTLYLEIQVVQIGVNQEGSSLFATADSGTFQWVECPDYDIIPGATDSTFTPTQNGSYAVIVTQNGYTDTSDCITVSNVGIVDVSLNNNIRVYPNPVQDQVHIEVTNWPAKMAKIVVRDVSGKKVYTEVIEPISNLETIHLNTTQWARGTYFVEVGEGVNKVVKQIIVN